MRTLILTVKLIAQKKIIKGLYIVFLSAIMGGSWKPATGTTTPIMRIS